METPRSTVNYEARTLLNPRVIIFWIIFALAYLFLNRVLIVLTQDKFRLGLFVLLSGVLLILLLRKIANNTLLTIGITLFVGIILISTWANNIPLIQFLAFVRIPFVFYLIYNIVSLYLNSEQRVVKVLRVLYIIAALQLPIMLIQRLAYPYLPESIRFGSSMIDIGMGSFSGDTSMAYALIGLVILLLFEVRVNNLFRWKWLLAGWLSLTVLASNSQAQHMTIVVVWVIFLLSHFSLKYVIILSLFVVLIMSLIVVLSQLGLLTYPFLQNTLIKISAVNEIFVENVDYEDFLSGGYDRGAAISYYLNQPIKWIGDGPGTVYDTASGRRTVGAWGHAFTFYAEVGLIGWLLSILIFFVIAFPIYLGTSSVKVRISWVGALMFLTAMIVSFVKYPMGDTAMAFTYCVILISYQVLSAKKSDARHHHPTVFESAYQWIGRT